MSVNIYFSSLLENIKLNLFESNKSLAKVLVLGYYLGGGKIGSTAIFIAFSIIFGITLANRGQLISRLGFVFT